MPPPLFKRTILYQCILWLLLVVVGLDVYTILKVIISDLRSWILYSWEFTENQTKDTVTALAWYLLIYHSLWSHTVTGQVIKDGGLMPHNFLSGVSHSYNRCKSGLLVLYCASFSCHKCLLLDLLEVKFCYRMFMEICTLYIIYKVVLFVKSSFLNVKLYNCVIIFQE